MDLGKSGVSGLQEVKTSEEMFSWFCVHRKCCEFFVFY